MKLKHHISIIILSAIFAGACGGGGSSGGSANGGSTGGNPTEPVPPPVVYDRSAVGVDFTYEDDRYTTTQRGIDFNTTVELWVNGQPRLYQNPIGAEKTYYIALEGDYTRAFGGSYTNSNIKDSSFSFFGIQGEVSSQAPTGLVTYNGVYQRANAETARVDFNNIILFANFNAGSITGNAISPFDGSEVIQITGQINGVNVRLNIRDDNGIHIADGKIFGPNGAEIAAGFINEELVGILYGSRN